MVQSWLNRGRYVALASVFVAASVAVAQPAFAQDKYKVGIVTFLSGPAAPPFGIPGKNGAEMMIDEINKGSMPAPYNTKGMGGVQLEAIYSDENGPTAEKVTDYRNLVQRDKVDFIVGYVSSGNCLAVAPVAEELKTLTVMYDCGTPRLFEDASYKYVFRASPHAVMDNVGAAYYVKSKFPELKAYAGINQNYAWGQDSWRDFTLSMKTLLPVAENKKELFPKLLAGEYGSEVSALLVSGANLAHTSLWGGDLESFVFQATARGLPQKMPLVITPGESAMFRLGEKLPDGSIIGARGPHGVLAQPSTLDAWFKKTYTERFKAEPTYPPYHMAQSIMGLKTAIDKAAAANGGKRPTTELIVAAFEGLEFDGPSTTIKMTLGKGHQGISDTAYGTYKFDKATGKPTIVDVQRYGAECVNPPEGVKGVEWLEKGMPGAKC